MSGPEARIAQLEKMQRDLRTELARLRGLVLTLVDHVPLEHVAALARVELRPGDESAASGEMFSGWSEGTQLTPADVASEMRLLWQRCGRTA